MSQIRLMYGINNDNITEGELQIYANNLEKHRYDPLDYIIANHYKVFGIITDDSDFTYDANIKVYKYSP